MPDVMKVLLIHQAFVAPSEAGGTRHFELARHCRSQGIEFFIIASDLSYLTGKKANFENRLVYVQNTDGLKIYRAYTYKAHHKSFVKRTLSFLSFMCTSFLAAFRIQNVDVVMGTSPPIFQAVSAWMVSRIKRVPFLIEVRDLWPAFAVDMGVLKNPLLIKMSESLESFLYAQADHIIVNSPAYRDYLIDRGISPEKVSLVPNGVDPQMFKPNGNGKNIRDKLVLHGKYIVTYAGALGMANDIPTLIKAAERLKHEKNVHFLLVGDGKDRNKLESTAKTLKLENITFAGAVPKSHMPEYLAASNACVAILKNIPMFKTTYPNKVFDYMAAGRPTILAIDGVIRDVIEDAKGGIFVPPGDDSALADAVRNLARDSEKTTIMGRNAREYVVKHFNRKHHSQAFVDLINQKANS